MVNLKADAFVIGEKPVSPQDFSINMERSSLFYIETIFNILQLH
jgi:hypothetical protein